MAEKQQNFCDPKQTLEGMKMLKDGQDPKKNTKPQVENKEAKTEGLEVSGGKYENKEDGAGFLFEDILFKVTENDKIKCGICQVECNRLIVHMNQNEYCTQYFSNMAEFKLEYSRYRHSKSNRKKKEKRESGSPKKGMKQENMDMDTSLQEENPQYCKIDKDRKSETEDSASFQYEGICFQDIAKNKVRCGVCQVECVRLIVHLNGSPDCANCFTNMVNLKIEYSK